MGYVAYAPARRRHGQRGRPRASSPRAPCRTTSWIAAITEVKAHTDQPFGVNFRADAPDAAERVDLIIREGIKVAGTALAPKQELIERAARRGRRGDPVDRGQAPRPEGRASGASTPCSCRAARAAATPAPSPPPCCCPRSSTRSRIPVIGAGGFHDGRGLVAALSWGACGVAMGTRFLLTQESPVPQHVKDRYLAADRHRHGRHHQGRRRAQPGAAQPVRRPARVDHARSPRCPGPSATPFAWKKISGTTWKDMITEGLAMKGHGDVGWLGRHPGGQHADPLPLGHGRGRRRARRDVVGPVGRRHRRPADGRRAHPADHVGGARRAGPAAGRWSRSRSTARRPRARPSPPTP